MGLLAFIGGADTSSFIIVHMDSTVSYVANRKCEFFPCKKVGKLILLRNTIILLSTYYSHWACNALCEYVDNKIRKSH